MDAVPRKSLVTPFRVVMLAVVAVGALAAGFMPQLKQLWENRIMGKPHSPAQPSSVPVPAVPPGGDAEKKSAEPPALPDSPAPVPPKPPGGTAPSTPTPTSNVAAPAEKPEEEEEESQAPTAPPVVDYSRPLPVGEIGARELITRLLYANKPEQVKPYILDAAQASGVDSYFTNGKAVPVKSHEIHLTGSEKSGTKGRMVWSFRIHTDKVRFGFPMAVEDTPEGLRTDWTFFTQCRDGSLKAFLEDPAAPPATFFVSLLRAHPFPDMLPEKDVQNFIPFSIASPVLGDTRTNVFVSKSSPLAARVDTLYKWQVEYAPSVTLAHKGGHVEIMALVRETWRSASASPRPGSSR
jgi:hypothetical protein